MITLYGQICSAQFVATLKILPSISGLTPSTGVKLEDFTLTRLDRPHHIYLPNGQLVHTADPNAQKVVPITNPSTTGKESPGVVRSYVHSNSHYAMPTFNEFESMETLPVARIPSTENLVPKKDNKSELPGIDNPSVSSDDILDSGNESDHVSSKQESSPDVSPGKVNSPLEGADIHSTPGGAPTKVREVSLSTPAPVLSAHAPDVGNEGYDFPDGGATTHNGAQADNEISEAYVKPSEAYVKPSEAYVSIVDIKGSDEVKDTQGEPIKQEEEVALEINNDATGHDNDNVAMETDEVTMATGASTGAGPGDSKVNDAKDENNVTDTNNVLDKDDMDSNNGSKPVDLDSSTAPGDLDYSTGPEPGPDERRTQSPPLPSPPGDFSGFGGLGGGAGLGFMSEEQANKLLADLPPPPSFAPPVPPTDSGMGSARQSDIDSDLNVSNDVNRDTRDIHAGFAPGFV